MQEYALTVGAEEAALTIEAHINMEAVNIRVVTLEGLCELEFIGCKERTFHKADNSIATFSVTNLRIGCDVLEVYGFKGEFSMQFSQVPISVAAKIVVDAIGHIAGLLNLSYHHTRTDAVNTASRDVEAVAFADVDFVQVVLNTMSWLPRSASTTYHISFLPIFP